MTAALVIFVIARAGAPSSPPGPAANPTPTLEAVVTASPPAEPSTEPTAGVRTPEPTAEPTLAPTPEPTAEPTAAPSPTPGVTAVPTPTASFRTYTVQSNETLWSISQKFGVTVKAIMKANNMTTTVIHRGKVLIIP
jgi:LysM repeat protein